MELTEQRAARIMGLLRRREDLEPRPLLDDINAANLHAGLGVELLGRKLFPNEEEITELGRLTDRIRKRSYAENTARLRELGVEITETEEMTDGEA